MIDSILDFFFGYEPELEVPPTAYVSNKPTTLTVDIKPFPKCEYDSLPPKKKTFWDTIQETAQQRAWIHCHLMTEFHEGQSGHTHPYEDSYFEVLQAIQKFGLEHSGHIFNEKVAYCRQYRDAMTWGLMNEPDLRL